MARLRLVRERPQYCPGIDFEYDLRDYLFIPGLYRGDDVYLVPVFFDYKVLSKYYTDPNYSVEFASETYGDIRCLDGGLIAFGINRANLVVMWLGDIDRELDKPEQHYLRSYNIPSDHDIASEFYEAQIQAQFTPPSAESQLLYLRNDLSKIFLTKYRTFLFRSDETLRRSISSARKPVLFTDDELLAIVSAWHKILIESIDSAGLKELCLSMGIQKVQLDKKRSLKLLELLLIQAGVGSPSDLLSPLFVLYDLRTALSHDMPTSKVREILDRCAARLSLPPNCDSKTIFGALVPQLESAMEGLNRAVENVAGFSNP